MYPNAARPPPDGGRSAGYASVVRVTPAGAAERPPRLRPLATAARSTAYCVSTRKTSATTFGHYRYVPECGYSDVEGARWPPGKADGHFSGGLAEPGQYSLWRVMMLAWMHRPYRFAAVRFFLFFILGLVFFLLLFLFLEFGNWLGEGAWIGCGVRLMICYILVICYLLYFYNLWKLTNCKK